ncbi:MAG: ATP-binding protein [Thermodesulfobacteriota bacterium]
MNRHTNIEARIRQTLADHEEYGFTRLMDYAFKAFLDLTLEYQDLEDFKVLVVRMPQVVLGWDASLYLTDEDASAHLAASTLPDLQARLEAGERTTVNIYEEARQEEDAFLVPLWYRNAVPAGPNQEAALSPIVGMLGVTPGTALDDREIFFLHKYADLVALSVVQRLLARKNQQHINFIKNLVADIGHNVIVPNIFFKAYLRRLKGKIEHLAEIQDRAMALVTAPPQALPAGVRDVAGDLANVNEGLREEFENIDKHYVNTSLFLETLLRQSHFERGRYVLQKKPCNFSRDIIGPQMERYGPRLRERGIGLDLSLGGVPDQPIEAVVDVGLISQVYANFLSNAIKYTRPMPTADGERKFIAYGLELIRGAFGPGSDGVKLNLFSTGRPLGPDESSSIFGEGYRGPNVERERGTGHGLFFVKEVIELHGGRAGHEPTPMGNNFYFILPI